MQLLYVFKISKTEIPVFDASKTDEDGISHFGFLIFYVNFYTLCSS